MSEYSVQTPTFVNVIISTSCDSNTSQKRFSKANTISELKAKLELITGGSSSTMTLSVFDKEDKFVCPLNDDNAMLGSYPVDDGMRLHVVDKFIVRKQCEEEIASAQRFSMSEEEYSKRPDSLLAYLKRNKLGKFKEGGTAKREAEAQKQEEIEKEAFDKIEIGNRCQTRVPGQPTRLGSVMFKGKTSFKEGLWVGVKYDLPLGRNDGSVDGVRYFDCLPNYGGFVQPQYVEVGEFPPEDDLDLEEEI